MALGKDEILAAAPKSVADLPRELVPFGKGEVLIRGITATERDAFEAESREIRKSGSDVTIGVRARILAWSIVGEDGVRLLDTVKDAAAIGRYADSEVEQAFARAASLGGFTDADVKELEKN